MYDDLSFDQTSLYISGVFVQGVQSINTSWTYPEDSVQPMGFSTAISNPVEGGLESEVTVNRVITSSSDVITGLFEGNVSGHLRYRDDNDGATAYLFSKGYVSDYSCSCAVDDLPTSDFTLYTYGEVLGSVEGWGDQPGPEEILQTDLVLPGAGDIELNITDEVGGHTIDLSTNAVQEFEYKISMDWESIYALGSRKVAELVLRKAPVVEMLLTIELNDFVPPNFTELLCNTAPVLKNITIKIKDCSPEEGVPGKTIKTLVCPCARLVEFNQLGDVGDVLLAEIGFKSNNRTLQELKGLVF